MSSALSCWIWPATTLLCVQAATVDGQDLPERLLLLHVRGVVAVVVQRVHALDGEVAAGVDLFFAGLVGHVVRDEELEVHEARRAELAARARLVGRVLKLK